MSAPVLSWLFNALGKGFRRNALGTPWEPPDRSSAQPVKAAQCRVGSVPLFPETPRPNPQSQSFSRSYGSILPTSLIYIVLSTRGCTPWRPDAVMSTTRGANKSLHRIFKGRRKRTGQRKDCPAFPVAAPYRRVIRFQGPAGTVKKKRELFPGLPLTSPVSLASPLSIHVLVEEY